MGESEREVLDGRISAVGLDLRSLALAVEYAIGTVHASESTKMQCGHWFVARAKNTCRPELCC